MQIPSKIYQNFGTKVFSCKANQLSISQTRRAEKFQQELRSQRNELLEGNLNDIHPAWKNEKEIERKSENFINYILNPKSSKKDIDLILAKTFNIC